MINAGDMNQRVTLQQPGGAADALGERVTTWADVATVWASVWPLSTRDTLIAAQTNSEITHRVRVRYSSVTAGIGPDWRLKLGTRVLVIVGAPRNLGEAKHTIELLCSEGMRQE